MAILVQRLFCPLFCLFCRSRNPGIGDASRFSSNRRRTAVQENAEHARIARNVLNYDQVHRLCSRRAFRAVLVKASRRMSSRRIPHGASQGIKVKISSRVRDRHISTDWHTYRSCHVLSWFSGFCAIVKITRNLLRSS